MDDKGQITDSVQKGIGELMGSLMVILCVRRHAEKIAGG
jgi:hypothetical protein